MDRQKVSIQTDLSMSLTLLGVMTGVEEAIQKYRIWLPDQLLKESISVTVTDAVDTARLATSAQAEKVIVIFIRLPSFPAPQGLSAGILIIADDRDALIKAVFESLQRKSPVVY